MWFQPLELIKIVGGKCLCSQIIEFGRPVLHENYYFCHLKLEICVGNSGLK